MIKAIIIFVLVLIVFNAWLVTFGIITAGDFAFYFKENLNQLFSPPYVWDGFWSPSAIGQYKAAFLFPYLPLFLSGLISRLGLSFVLVERLVWLFPFLALSIFSSWYLAKTLFPKNSFLFLAPFVFLFNTYILMIVGGGQMGLALAYAIAPLLFGVFVKSIQTPNFKLQTITGLFLGLSLSFDPRISLLTMGMVVLYLLFSLQSSVFSFQSLVSIIVPIVIATLLHSYWLLPLVLVRRPSLPQGYGDPGWVEFLSFGNFSDSLSLLHPNWPENIFGKVYFMRPEFLVIPIFAFSSLLFLKNLKQASNFHSEGIPEESRAASISRSEQLQTSRNSLTILFFAFLALIGAFLAKGSKPPFGGIYLWLFKNFPGMNMFRDPTKFYLLVAVSYSVLIPFSLAQVIKQLKKVLNINHQSSIIKCLVLGIFILYWLFLIREAVFGQLGGTFKAKEVPVEYAVLKDLIHSQEEFFRTFWIPKKQRFGFRDAHHPAVNASELSSQEDLATIGIKYVIIPYDSEGEIFLEDRKYDHQQRLALEEELDKVSWLKKIDVTDKIAVYQTPSYKDHFWTERVRPLPKEELGQGLTLTWQMVNPTKYLVQVQDASQPFRLVFSETYDELWQAKIGNEVIPSEKRDNVLNSFTIDKTGDFEIVIEFVAQKYVYYGLAISAATLLAVSGALAYLWRKQ